MNPEPVKTDNWQALKAQYETDGYAIFRNVVDADLVREASAHIDWLIAKHPDMRPEKLWHTLVVTDPFWVRLVSDPRLLDLGQLFLGPNLALLASHYIAKPPFEGLPVLMHQDGSYWPLDPMEVITLWLAVDHSGQRLYARGAGHAPDGFAADEPAHQCR